MAVQPRGGFAVDRRIKHMPPGGGRLTGQHEQPGDVVADPVAHVGEGVEVLVGGQVPVRADGVRVHPCPQLAERGVGVDGHHPVVLAQFGEDGADTGRDRGLADPALAQHADLVLAAQQRANPGLQVCLLQLVGRLAEVDQPARGVVDQPPPTATRAESCGAAPTRWRGCPRRSSSRSAGWPPVCRAGLGGAGAATAGRSEERRTVHEAVLAVAIVVGD